MNSSFLITLHNGDIIQFPFKFSHYTFETVISVSTNSFVLLARLDKEDRVYACKVFVHSLYEKAGIKDHIAREISILKKLNHPNLLKLYDVLHFGDFSVVITNYYSCGELLKYLRIYDFPEDVILKLLYQIASALDYLNSLGIAHRDVKAENIMLDDRGNAILIDLGLSEEKNIYECQQRCGTSYYMAPEIIKGQKYDATKSDIWSLGILLFAMLTKSFPYDTDNINTILAQMRTLPYLINTSVNPKYQALVSSMLNEDPKARPSPKQIIEHLTKTYGLRVPEQTPENTNVPSHQPSVSRKNASVRVIIIPRKPAQKKQISKYSSGGFYFNKNLLVI